MAAPNILNLTVVTVDTAILEATNVETDLIAAVTTGHVINVDAIFCSNIHASIVGWVTIVHKKGGIEHKVANQLRVPIKTTVNALLGKPLYLAEGDSLRVQVNASSNVAVFAPYSDVTDV